MKTYFNLAEFGKRGQIRTLNARVARQELLLPGFGVYASPENLQRYTDIVIPEDAVQYSSTSVSEVRIHFQRSNSQRRRHSFTTRYPDKFFTGISKSTKVEKVVWTVDLHSI